LERRRRCFWKKERGVEVGLAGGGGGGIGADPVPSSNSGVGSSEANDGDDDERCEFCGDDTRVADDDDDRLARRSGPIPLLAISSPLLKSALRSGIEFIW
jgi:hypothetical protein